jgi:hypothetical protein
LNLLVDERKPWYSREVAESVEAKRLIASQDEIIEYIRATYPSEADSAKTWKNPLAARS